HEVSALGEAERSERLAEDALRAVDLPFRVAGRGDLAQDVGVALQQGAYLVSLVGDEVDLLCARGDRMLAAPDNVAPDGGPGEGHLGIRIRRVNDCQLEA